MSMSRRKFLGATASAVIVAGTMAKGRVFGANDRVNVCVMGINGRGKSHIKAFSAISQARVAGLCDVDTTLFDSRVEEYFGRNNLPKPKTYADIREVLDDKDIDAISTATPNHWHSLATIWACQAGKDMYVEKPMTHNIYEGLKVVEAAKKYNRIVQHGTQLRSNPGFQEGIQLLKDGFIGDVYMARCVCYKWRGDIGKGVPGQPPSTLRWDLWQGPAKEKPFMVKAANPEEGIFVPYYWHWVWEYGNGDIGNQGVHQLDAARWGLGVNTPYRVSSMGGLFLWDDAKEVYNVSSSSFMFKGADGKDKIMTLEVRPWYTNDEMGGTSFGVMFYGSEGVITFPSYSGYLAYKCKKFGESEMEPAQKRMDGDDKNHYQNFIDCVISRDASKITAPPIEGHYSSALSHYALTGARINRVLEINDQTGEITNVDWTSIPGLTEEEATLYLKRDYREGFEIGDEV
ncbi:MAG TPA: Gfo/Idh/MocA family oxidoreductase [Candidatus Hydrogenedentes bacterium]|nr:Gfo/Idh/MocA family oxidoreductase [Candidatus Hydrogenedentota bacterium]